VTVIARPAHGGEEVVVGSACGGAKDAMTAFLSINVLCVYIYWPHVLNPTWPTSSTFSAVCCIMLVWPTLTAKVHVLAAYS